MSRPLLDAARHFPGRLRYLREQAGLTQEELAQRSGIGRTYIAKLEAGSKLPGLNILLILVKHLQVTPNDLLQSS
jgi:transcriptional regulator with XRE-family HTH domain